MQDLVGNTFNLRCGDVLYTCKLKRERTGPFQVRRKPGFTYALHDTAHRQLFSWAHFTAAALSPPSKVPLHCTQSAKALPHFCSPQDGFKYNIKGAGWKQLVAAEKLQKGNTVNLQMSGRTVLDILLSDEQGMEAPAAATAAVPPPILAGGLGLWPGMLPGLWAAGAMATNPPAWAAAPAAATAAAPPPTLADGLGLLPASAMAANPPACTAEVAGAALGMPQQPQPEAALACELDSQLPAAAQCGEFMALMSDALMH